MPLAVFLPLYSVSPLHSSQSYPRRSASLVASLSIAAFRPWRRVLAGIVWVLALLFVFCSFATGQDALTVAWDANSEPDIEGYIVYLGTSTGQYMISQDVGTETSHQFTGLSATEVYYCAVQAYNTSGLASELSAEIVFTLQDVIEPYVTWASSAGLDGAAAEPSAIPFHDGVCNLMKFAFNMNANGPDVQTLVKGTGTAGLPVFSLDQSGAQPKFTVEYLRR